MGSDTGYILEMNHITKEFPGVKALKDVTFKVRKGVVHGLMGENGAGKSTLMKILQGIYTPTSGTMIFDGKPLELKTIYHGSGDIHDSPGNEPNSGHDGGGEYLFGKRTKE